MDQRRGPVLIASSTAGPLAARLAEALGVVLAPVQDEVFPDGERKVGVGQSVRNEDVFILSPTGAPVGESLLELRLIADACWHGGAARLVGVIPYFGYARQDRRGCEGEALGMRVAADLLAGAGFTRLVLVDLHTPASEGCFSCPVDHLGAVQLLAAALRPGLPEPAVVVAPDLGAAKLAGRFASLLGLPTALVQKTRLSGQEVTTGEVLGNVEGRVPLIVDDMISTGATIEGALRALVARGCRSGALVVATHGLLVAGAGARLAAAGVARILVTDSLPGGQASGSVPVERISLAPLLAERIRQLVRST